VIAPGAEETGGAVILHLTTVDEWSTALASGTYDRSTRGRSYAEVGFIHCSTTEQLSDVASFVYADCAEPLVVLVMSEPELVAAGVPVRYEDGGDGTRYPHLYGTVPCRLVRTVKRAAMDSGGRLHVRG
jgi:uncharacterized protein (DUF952 family)